MYRVPSNRPQPRKGKKNPQGVPLRPKGKDLSLLLAAKRGKLALPKDSLYFREMARTKKTARKKTGKTPCQNLVPKVPHKMLSQEQARKNAAKAVGAAQKNLGNLQTGGLKRPMRYRPGTVALREIRRYQKSTELLIRETPVQQTGEGDRSRFQYRLEVSTPGHGSSSRGSRSIPSRPNDIQLARRIRGERA